MKIATLLVLALMAANDWPQFLGPDRNGTSPDEKLVPAWIANGLRELWRVPLGEGYSGFAVRGDSAFTMYGNGREDFLIALDSRDGRVLWRYRTGPSPRDLYGGLGPRVTPAIDGALVLTMSAQGDVLALDAESGTVVWRRALASEHGFRAPAEGVASSPLVADGRVYVMNGGRDGRTVLALDASTGRTLWTSVDDRTSYSSPVRADVRGVPQAFFLTGAHLFSLDPASGRVLGSHPWPTYDYVNAATPLVVPPDRVFISSGYDQGAALLRLSIDGIEELWRSREMKNHFNNSVHYASAFLGFDQSILKAVDAETGALLWRERGFGHGSIIVVGSHLVILSDDGELSAARASREALRVEARHRVLDGKTWTPPSIAGGRIFVRNALEAVALAPASTSPREEQDQHVDPVDNERERQGSHQLPPLVEPALLPIGRGERVDDDDDERDHRDVAKTEHRQFRDSTRIKRRESSLRRALSIAAPRRSSFLSNRVISCAPTWSLTSESERSRSISRESFRRISRTLARIWPGACRSARARAFSIMRGTASSKRVRSRNRSAFLPSVDRARRATVQTSVTSSSSASTTTRSGVGGRNRDTTSSGGATVSRTKSASSRGGLAEAGGDSTTATAEFPCSPPRRSSSTPFTMG